MNKVLLFLAVVLVTSCTTTKTFTPPMTEEMYQAKKKNYLKKYTKKFVNSIPKKDIELITEDSITIVYDTINR